jgi:predicted nucleic acid-binding protein
MSADFVDTNVILYSLSDESALEVAARYGFSHYDSLIISAALESGCMTLYSEDL